MPNTLHDRIIIVLVHNQPGVLSKISSMFYRRGINIRTLTVGSTHEPEISKIVVRVSGTERGLLRLQLSMNNLVDVVATKMVEESDIPTQELCLARVKIDDRNPRETIFKSVEMFRPELVDIAGESIVLELKATPAVVDHFVDTLKAFHILEISRTGVTVMPGFGRSTIRSADGGRPTAIER